MPVIATTADPSPVIATTAGRHAGVLQFDTPVGACYNGSSMKVVIVGAGAVGFQLARQLIAEQRNVVLVEKNPAHANYASQRLDCMVLTGIGNNVDMLKQAGTDKADFLVAVTDSDEVNMICCALAATEFDLPQTIARVRNIDYAATGTAGRSFLGIDQIVNPEIEAAEAILRSIERGATSDVMLFERAGVQMRHINVDRSSYFKDKTLQEINQQFQFSFLVAVIVRQNDYIIPSGDTDIREGDLLYIVATEGNFEGLFDYLGKRKQELKRIVMLGGGKIGSLILDHFFTHPNGQSGRRKRMMRRIVGGFGGGKPSVKVVERDYAKSKQISERFPDALVINADITDEGIFEEEHFQNSDLIISATDNQELNIVSAVYGKNLGIRRAVVLVNKLNYAKIAANVGIDVTVSIKNAVVNSILKIIRRGKVRSLHSISDGRVEILELTVDAGSPGDGHRIEDVKLPSASLIVSVARGEEHVIPHGGYVLQADDNIIIITKKEFVDRVQGLFSARS
jgi:trk system potassium uptake protein TrkA